MKTKEPKGISSVEDLREEIRNLADGEMLTVRIASDGGEKNGKRRRA